MAEKTMVRLNLILATCFALTSLGCASQRFKKIKSGMDDKNVLSLMGQPTERTATAQGEMLSWWDYNVVLDDLGSVVYKFKGAADEFPMTVDAYAREAPQKKIATVLPSMAGVTANDLEFLQAKKLVEVLLRKKGYRISSNQAEIDTVVFINFGVSKPQKETKIWSEPVYSYNFQNLSTTHDVYGSTGAKLGQVRSNGTISGPLYSGERIQSQTVTTYVHHLIIEATDYAHFLAHKEVKPFWKVRVLEEGTSRDQRLVLPYMVYAAGGHLEENTDNELAFSVFGNDPRVAAFKRAGRSIANEHSELEAELDK